MHRSNRREFLRSTAAVSLGSLALRGTRLSGSEAGRAAADAAWQQAARSARIAGYSLSKVQRWLHERALPVIDPKTGLYPADTRWNYRDTAADCYPFLCWAALVTDLDALNGPVRDVLHAETRLCNQFGRIPVPYDWKRQTKITNLPYSEIVFQASEYVKDGLIAIVEATGKDEWFERMKGIVEDLWQRADIDSPYGKIISTNVEVNGEQLQALTRLFTMTGDERFLEWAERLGDRYLLDENFYPSRLRDHGCEIIGGIGLLLAVESVANPKKFRQYQPQVQRILDAVLARGTNNDGMMFNSMADRPGAQHGKFSDGWGYNYVGYLCYDMATGTDQYRPQVAKILKNLRKPLYQNYPWEGTSIDGFADSIEGAIYLVNRMPIPAALAWIDREMARSVIRSDEPLESAKLWGTMKLEANGVRTVIMHALMHTQGLIARPWRQDLTLGAARQGDSDLSIILNCHDQGPWQGRIVFDIPRYRQFMGFAKDWPRMNTLPEWFTVEAERSYTVRNVATGQRTLATGSELHEGLAVAAEPGKPLRLEVSPLPV